MSLPLDFLSIIYATAQGNAINGGTTNSPLRNSFDKFLLDLGKRKIFIYLMNSYTYSG